MKRFMYFALLIMCLAIALVIGIYIGGQLALALPVEESPQWDYNFYIRVKDGAFTVKNQVQVRESEIECKDCNTKKVPVDWILYQAARSAGKGEQWMFFIVTDSKGENILHPEAYKLYIGGYDPEMERISCFEDFPDIEWP